MLRALYDWIMRLAASRHAGMALFALAFGESFIVPIPPDAMLAPMVLARPQEAWRNAVICTVGSILGGLVGYYIGYALEPVAHSILGMTGHVDAEAAAQAAFARYGVIVILGGIAPIIPFPVITLASGLVHFSLWQFVLAASVARLARFLAVAAIVKRLGPAMLMVLERRLALASAILVVLAICVVAAVKLLHHA